MRVLINKWINQLKDKWNVFTSILETKKFIEALNTQQNSISTLNLIGLRNPKTKLKVRRNFTQYFSALLKYLQFKEFHLLRITVKLIREKSTLIYMILLSPKSNHNKDSFDRNIFQLKLQGKKINICPKLKEDCRLQLQGQICGDL